MIRILCVLSLVLVVTVYTKLTAQDDTKSDRPFVVDPNVVDPSTVPSDGPSDKGKATLEEIVNDKAIEPVAQTVSAVKQALLRTGRITIRYGGQQVTMPVVDGIPPENIAATILDHSQGLPETTLHIGKKSLLFSAAPDTARAVAQELINLMFVLPREIELKAHPKKDKAITAATVLMPDGAKAVPLESNDESIERVLRRAENISIMLNTYNLLIPLSDKSPHAELAKAILKVVKEDSQIQMLDGRKTLLLDPPVSSIQKVFHAIAVVLMPSASAQGKDNRVENADESLPAPPPAKPDDKTQVWVFALIHAQADVLEKIFQQLFRENVVVRADVRTNQLIVSGPAKLLDEVKTLVIKLDQAGPKVVDLANAKRPLGISMQATDGNLKESYATQQKSAAELANKMRGSDQPTDKLKSQLRDTVARAFELRQQLHQAELAAFQQRMEKVRQTIQAREKVKDKIIDRHVEDLLNPGLKWESKSESTPETGPGAMPVQTTGPTELEGEWNLVSITGGGVTAHEQGLKLRIEKNQWVMSRGTDDSHYTIAVNPATNPKLIDLVAAHNDELPHYFAKGIYRLDDDTLIIAWSSNLSERPASLEGANVRLHTWKRAGTQNEFLQLDFTGPKKAAIATLDQNGFVVSGGKTEFHLPIRRRYVAAKAHRLLLSQIPYHTGLELFLALDIPPVTDKVRDFVNLNKIPLQVTDDDIQQAAKGNLILKVIYLKTPAVEGATQSVETIISSRTDPKVDPIGEARKLGTVLAVMGVQKMMPATEPPLARTGYGQPAAQPHGGPTPGKTEAETVVPKSEEIRIFDPSQSIPASVTVGVVSKVSETGVLEISLAEPGTAKVGDVWEASRLDLLHPEMGRRFARVKVIEVQKEKAYARMIETSRVRQENEYIYDQVDIGDELGRQPHGTPFPDPEAEAQTNTAKPEIRTILKEAEDFQQQFITLENTLAGHRDSLRQARAALEDGRGSQKSIDDCQIQVDAWQKRLDVARAGYAAQLRLLELDVGKAKQEVEVAEQELRDEQQEDRPLKGLLQKTKQRKLQQNLSAALLRVEQAATLLELYRKVAQAPDETSAATESKPQDKAAANLRAIMLALHHYHDQHRHFPPATTLGKDGKGKIPHSWRVEILPQLGEQKLYDEYRFDEPWDSDYNKSLLLKMPPVFRSPLDKPDSPFASYFALVTPDYKPQSGGVPAAGAAGTVADMALAGPRYDLGTVFSNPLGTKFLDIHDGTANTVTLVEAKRAIPWTKPEDITYSALQPVPVLGDWFPAGWHAGFAEGSVKLISPDNPDAILRALFTIGGGENVKPKTVDDSPQGTRR